MILEMVAWFFVIITFLAILWEWYFYRKLRKDRCESKKRDI